MEVYDNIAQEFSNTRYALWKGVKTFLDTLPKHSVVIDVGCGNGKYLGYRKDLFVIGNDACVPLAEIAGHKGEVLVANGLLLPYLDKSIDAGICIAVLHHMGSLACRRALVKEIARVVKGQFFITVWRTGIEKKSWTPLGNNDWLVPWNNRFQRYYHLFSEEDIKETFEGYDYTCYEELGNWHVCVS